MTYYLESPAVSYKSLILAAMTDEWGANADETCGCLYVPSRPKDLTLYEQWVVPPSRLGRDGEDTPLPATPVPMPVHAIVPELEMHWVKQEMEQKYGKRNVHYVGKSRPFGCTSAVLQPGTKLHEDVTKINAALEDDAVFKPYITAFLNTAEGGKALLDFQMAKNMTLTPQGVRYQVMSKDSRQRLKQAYMDEYDHPVLLDRMKKEHMRYISDAVKPVERSERAAMYGNFIMHSNPLDDHALYDDYAAQINGPTGNVHGLLQKIVHG